MPNRTSTYRFLMLALVALCAYLAVTVPPEVVQQYNELVEQSTVLAYLYLAVVASGGVVLIGLVGWAMWRLWRNTRQRERSERRRNQNPSQLSTAAQRAELQDNLQAGRNYAAQQGMSDAVRAEIERAVAEVEAKRQTERLEIVAFGSISSGKSSLLNALAGRDVFSSDVIGGTTTVRSQIDWPGSDHVVLVDTPGLGEVDGAARGKVAATAAESADLVLMVVDGPLRDYEFELLESLVGMEKRVLLCLNKADWYTAEQRAELCDQMASQVQSLVQTEDVVSVRSRPAPRPIVRVLADGSEEEDEVIEPPDIEPLAQRLLTIVTKERESLLLANLLMQSRGLVDTAKERVRETLDQQAEKVISRYMWAAGGATAANPVPLLDIAGGTALTVKMVLDLANVYQQKIDSETIIELLSQLAKSLVAMLGASAAAPALASGIGTLLKTIPGIGTIAGGLLQGLVQALVTRWVGRVFLKYFRNEMAPPAGGFAELARREWKELTRPEQLRQLIALGRRKLGE